MLARNLGLAMALLLLGGCGFFAQKHAETMTLGDSNIQAITYPPELRAAYAVNEGSTARYCAEPPPDVALSTIQKIAGEAKATTESGTEAEGKFSAEASTTALELAGRTQIVLLAREMLYRICELSLNSASAGQSAPAADQPTGLSGSSGSTALIGQGVPTKADAGDGDNPSREDKTPGGDGGTMLTAKDIVSLYLKVADVVRDFAAADRADAKAKAAAAQTKLINAQQKVRAQIEVEDAKIRRILVHLTGNDGTLDQEAVKKLVAKAKDDLPLGAAADIEKQIRPGDLETLLKEDWDGAIDPLYDALPNS